MRTRWLQPLRSTALLVALLSPLLGLASAGLASCTDADSVETGCTQRADCPRPDRQICDVETGVCVGFTSLPGQVDGGDGEGVDGGATDAGR